MVLHGDLEHRPCASSNAFLKTNLQATVTEMTDLNRTHREQQ